MENGYAPGDGGNIRMSTTQTTGELVIAEGTVITGGQAKNGGNLYVDVKGPFTMTGGTISGNIAGNAGGIIVQGKAHLTMTGGYVANNTTKTTGTVTNHTTEFDSEATQQNVPALKQHERNGLSVKEDLTTPGLI